MNFFLYILLHRLQLYTFFSVKESAFLDDLRSTDDMMYRR
ncbi:hypothetical protein CHCC14820_2776 [Bacillus paralicheniformis]|uniref:Uncharacterized protein n=1 Tax=Bacillus paralicheniformis TaxID=1648923 RepID=A0ABY3FXE1_9BACI|nr:hypothetical protein B4123_0894 [Bacillus paralicheniformis]TWJ41733.1 hypothetical protein CHCC5027_3793 [Bacillus paralicheniformis]TWJ51611.1 hypothetical protein CHCC5023_0343 [Bacillus paralicheniformis]TWJ63749.1 hypothetical protein CHCC5021_2693 [Bacillus paralicheniformis]TWJ76215.1 hypothetical protein CHCC5019_1474 [Bacillus paralicheniformis]